MTSGVIEVPYSDAVLPRLAADCMNVEYSLLDVLQNPQLIINLNKRDQSRIVRQARQTGLLGFIEARVEPGTPSGKLADHLSSARVHAAYHEQMISWEIDRLAKVLGSSTGPVILLKGAAYKALDLGISQGRLASDVDLLVPKEKLVEAEGLLLTNGWSHMKEDEYDQHYYREWMHELPPLRHEERGTVVDLHHAILPPTARLKPDSRKLIESALPLDDLPFFSLCPEDTLLHRAAHLFYDGDLESGLRELVDIHELINTFNKTQDFSSRLVSRSRELGLSRPLYFALYFCRRLLNTQFDNVAELELRREMAGFPIRQLLTYLLELRLVPVDPDLPAGLKDFAAGLLFVRSHWLRMPPLMLARHLLTQVRRRGGIKTG